MNILVYGDSNSWGYLDDGTGERHSNRWPVVMAERLSANGQPITLIEECLPGRTTDLDDPQEESGANHFNGALHMAPILLSHQPLDHVIIMLGTNDFKLRMNRSTEEIAMAIRGLAMLAASLPAGFGGWQATQCPAVSVIAPPPLGKTADNPSWERFAEWTGGREKSLGLFTALRDAMSEVKSEPLDASQAVASSEIDPIHWSAQSHETFGAWMAERMDERLSARTRT